MSNLDMPVLLHMYKFNAFLQNLILARVRLLGSVTDPTWLFFQSPRACSPSRDHCLFVGRRVETGVGLGERAGVELLAVL